MLCRVLLFLALIIGVFFAFRYFSLLYAMKKTEEEIREIQQDLTQIRFRIMQDQDLIFLTMRSFHSTGKRRKVFTGWSRGSMRKNSII